MRRRRSGLAGSVCGSPRAMHPGVNHMAESLLEARNLKKSFRSSSSLFATAASGDGGRIAAVNDVSLAIATGETLAIVGESGCGKTTLARLLLRLIGPDTGEIHFTRRDLLPLHGTELRSLRREIETF